MLKHIVMWRFLEQVEGRSKQENMDRIRQSLLDLRPVIPELLDMTVGRDIGVGRDTYDMVLVATFADAEALERYQHHPAHQAVSAEVAKIRAARACIDYLC